MSDFLDHMRVPQARQDQWQALSCELAPLDRMAIAYSGGVDSTFLLWFVAKVLRKKILPILVVSPMVSGSECAAARVTARQLGFKLEELSVDVLSITEVAGNARNRCYVCKRAMLEAMMALTQRLGYSVVLDGTNVDDLSQHRPGLLALQELGVLSPLASSRLTKTAIRELSRLAGLPTWNKPSQACLATRVPYGVSLSGELLGRIERAEAYLSDLGCTQVRVRVHDKLARIELNPEDFPLLVEPVNRRQVVEHFNQLGFIQVSLDLAGYRSGSIDADSAGALPLAKGILQQG
jgi:pyridinium-3,5-biscarboxylic acid mononucleotide sulfurtransferase